MLLLVVPKTYGLSTQEIINQSKESIVVITQRNSKTGERWYGTGWFVTENRIVTNSHIATPQTGVDQFEIVNIATGRHYVVDHLAYNNSATDIAVIVMEESNPTHLNLSTYSVSEGQSLVIIGNPEGEFGKVWEGSAGKIINYGFDKHENYMIVNAI